MVCWYYWTSVAALLVFHVPDIVFSSSSSSSSSSACETLKTKLSYRQENAPKDISDVLRVVVEKINTEVDGVLDVNVGWNGGYRVVGDHYVRATVTREGSEEEDEEDDERSTSSQCFLVHLEISDSNECTLPLGHDMRHRCEAPGKCVNTVGGYECVCASVTNKENEEYDAEVTWGEDDWSRVSSSPRTDWDVSLPQSSYCPSSISTHGCCPVDARSALGQECRSHFACPTNPCVGGSASPCDPRARCELAPSPPHYSCTCPTPTLGNGKACRPGLDPPPLPQVKLDGVTPTTATRHSLPTLCGCTTPTLDPCANMTCPGAGECVAGRCVDATLPTLVLRGDDPVILQRGDVYREDAVDVLDDDQAELYARSLRIRYSRPLSPGRCLTQSGNFTVRYLVDTPQLLPRQGVVEVRRTVEVRERDVCAIPKEDYEKWCDEILPRCHDNAVCTNVPNGYRCDCPDGMTGDATVDGTGCVDNKPPKITLLGPNPRIFRVARATGITGYLYTNQARDNQSKEQTTEEIKWAKYEKDLLSLIDSTAGAELCATQFTKVTSTTTSTLVCAEATDESPRGRPPVVLTNRVVLGTPIRQPPSSQNPQTYVWKVPYDVTDRAGNQAPTQYREVRVVELDWKELETSVRAQVEQEAYHRGREEGRREQATTMKTTTEPVSSCPVCRACPEVSVDSCRTVCSSLSSSESCQVTTTTDTTTSVGTSLPTTEVVYWTVVLVLVLLLYVIYRFFSNMNNNHNDDYYYKADFTAQDEIMANAVTYHSPEPLHHHNTATTSPYSQQSQSNGWRSAPPPRSSMSMGHTPQQHSSNRSTPSSTNRDRNNLFNASPATSERYGTPSMRPITPSRS